MHIHYSFYKDVQRTFLVLLGPASEQYGYQYRMLAANRIPGLLPCALRHVNDRSFLYYDVTARRALYHLWGPKEASAEEVRELLYAIARTQKQMAAYLLQAEKMLLPPEFVFRDMVEGDYHFLYYPCAAIEAPEEGEEAHRGSDYGALFSFLLEALEPGEEELRKLLEKLFTMSALPEFVLQEALLEELEDEAGQSDGKEEGFSFEWIGEEKLLFEEKETLADRRGEEARSDDGREKAARRKREGPPTGRIFFAAALFLLGGLCLEYFRLYHPSLEAAQLPAKGVALAMLLFSALLSLAAVGLLFLGERHRQKDEEQERTARKREELRPTYEYA